MEKKTILVVGIFKNTGIWKSVWLEEKYLNFIRNGENYP